MRRAYVLMVLLAAFLPQVADAGDAARFHGFRTLRPFLHELWFDDYDPDVSGKALSANRIGFACSAVRSGDFHGRNFDFLYTDTPEFIVHVAADPKRGTPRPGSRLTTPAAAGRRRTIGCRRRTAP